jgi:hypothetical protein
MATDKRLSIFRDERDKDIQQFGIPEALFDPAWGKKQIASKLLQLIEFYEIPKDDLMFSRLALRLAQDCVKGFRVIGLGQQKRPGRRRKWDLQDQQKLVEEIDLILRDPRMKLGPACSKFLKKHSRNPKWVDLNPRTVESLYRAAKMELRRRKLLSDQSESGDWLGPLIKFIIESKRSKRFR